MNAGQLAVAKYGNENQKLIAIEEMAELTTALTHERRGKATPHEVIEEIADVILALESLKAIYGNEHIEKQYFIKRHRLLKRLEDE